MAKPHKCIAILALVVLGCGREVLPHDVGQKPPDASTVAIPQPCECEVNGASVSEESLVAVAAGIETRLKGQMEAEISTRVTAEVALQIAAMSAPVATAPPVTVRSVAVPEAAQEGDIFDTETVWRVALSGLEPQRGPRTAAITLILWSSVDCALCRRQAGIIDELMGAYGDRVRLVWKSHPAPQSEADEWAAQAACAAARQGRFWEYREQLKGAGAEPRNESFYVGFAAAVGMEPVRFRRDMVSGACRQHLDADRDTAARVGIRGVPALTVNGRKTPEMVTLELLEEIISEELAKVAAMEVDGVAPERIYDELVADGEVQRPLSEEVFSFATTATLVGSDEATHVLTVFGDYECPYSRALYPNIERLLAAFPESLAVEFRNFPMPYHGTARLAAEASLEAAAQGEFPRFHAGLLNLPGDFSMKQLERLAKRSKVNLEELRTALKEGRHGTALELQIAEARQAGVWSTPSIFIDGRRYLSPDRSFEALQALLSEK